MSKVYNRIESITGNVITVRANGVKYKELAQINTRFGKSLAQVNKIDGDIVSLQVFAGGKGVSTGDEVRFLGHEMRVSFSEDLLGRIFNGSGEPRDKGPVLTENMKPIGGPSVNPTKRILANRMMRTNIPMIDMFNTLVVSQKLPIFSISGEPYNQLLARIAMQAEADVIVLGGMGLKYDDFLYFKDALSKGGALSKTVMFIHTASDPTVECMMIPDMVLAVTTMPGDDVTHPVPDNTGYITEGQYYLKGGRIEPFGSLSRLKQNVNGKTRKDHRALMDAMIRMYSSYKETLEKKNMGFSMSRWDEKLLKYGELFESKLMSLSVNLPLEGALDLGWEILADCFEKDETGIKSDLTDEFWPKS